MRSGPPKVRKPLETSKSHERRVREGWYEKYCPPDQPGIDIGCADDPVYDHFDQWDMSFGDGDAMLMEGVPAEKYHTVYASHILEHVNDPIVSVRRWYELVRPGGHLIVCVPHRDLYEKRTLLPSKFNDDHKFFWLPDRREPPHTLSLTQTIHDALQTVPYEIISLRVLDHGWIPVPVNKHSDGEYAIEAVIHKPAGAVAASAPRTAVEPSPAAPIPVTLGERDPRTYVLETRIADLEDKLAQIYGTRTWQWRTKLVQMFRRRRQTE
jgi:SAM-dependent methyltransferase